MCKNLMSYGQTVFQFRVLICLLCLISNLVAAQSLAIDYLKGEGRVQGLRLAYRPYSGSLSLNQHNLDLHYYTEISFIVWQFGENNRHQTNRGLSISPVFTGYLNEARNIYWEAGIGISLLNETQFAGKNIGSHYQFEDRLGINFVIDKSNSLAIRYMHYSNGGLNSHNPGMDFLSLSYSLLLE